MSSLLSPCRFTAALSGFTPSSRISGGRIGKKISLSLRSNSMSHSISACDSVLTESTPVASPNDVVQAENNTDDVIVQYVVLRQDLIDTWPLGSVVTQGCHASVSAIWSHRDDPHTRQYCSTENIDSMHKATDLEIQNEIEIFVSIGSLEVKGETQILNLSEKLKVGGIDHKLWIEQPESFPTCLPTKPYPKSMVSLFFKNLKLCK